MGSSPYKCVCVCVCVCVCGTFFRLGGGGILFIFVVVGFVGFFWYKRCYIYDHSPVEHLTILGEWIIFIVSFIMTHSNVEL